MFNISTTELANLLIPPFLKKESHVAWVESLLEPLGSLNISFLAWVDEQKIELEYNGQTLLLEKMLNDKFDPVSRRIAIVHKTETRVFDELRSEAGSPDFDYLISEAGIARFMEFRAERATSAISGFEARIPIEYSSIDDQIKGKILQYKIAVVNYATTYY